MNDKKDYINVLKALHFNGSFPTILTKIGAASIGSDDTVLKELAENLATDIRTIIGPLPVPGNVRTSLLARSASKDFPLPQYAIEHLAKLKIYCEACIASIEPQWMILARRAGWAPPPA